MESSSKNEINPLSDLIPDNTFKVLENKGLLNKKSLRDHVIRKKFLELKQNDVTMIEAIETIRKEYPYLQFDTIRKIVYQIQK
ncbi:MAG: hypothetical protein M1495_11280 [Bacteroidetes bacterium]|nr:hypothetical protein [Bacteroidota bacterium]